ncbi:MAG TPA: sialidase family protein [Thermoanaerobaculia bacterium]|nr:sialidase family protein [Thermoanaerobaculia bacterium]
MKPLATAVVTTVLLILSLGCTPETGQGESGGEAGDSVRSALAAPRAVDSPAGPGSAQPFLTTMRDGTLLMSWFQARTGSDGHALMISSFDGVAWSKASTIAEGKDFFVNWADFPSVVETGDGRLVAHWLQKSGTATYAYDVRVAQSVDGGATWSESFVIHDDGTKTEHGFASLVALPNGGVAALWLDGRLMSEGEESGPMTVRFAEFDASGVLSQEAMLDAMTCECCQTAMVLTDAGLLAAYRDRSEGEVRDIAIVRRIDDGWTEPKLLHADGWKITGCPVNGPQMDARGRDVVIAWFTAAGEEARVNVAFSSDSGASFTPPMRIDGGSPKGRVDVVMLSDRSALVTWVEQREGVARVLGRHVGLDATMGEPFDPGGAGASTTAGFPRLARTDDTLYAAWPEPGESGGVRLAAIPVVRKR